LPRTIAAKSLAERCECIGIPNPERLSCVVTPDAARQWPECCIADPARDTQIMLPTADAAVARRVVGLPYGLQPRAGLRLRRNRCEFPGVGTGIR
jgi:hypothetical protein